MMTITKEYYKITAEGIIKNMQKRNFSACYVDTKEQAAEKVLSLIKDGSTVSWGGSMTLQEIGLIPMLEKNTHLILLDRSKIAREKVEDLYRQVFSCDYYLMSSNAITLDGKLVNIDAIGNRVAALIYGPKQVILVVGMNKVAANEQEAIRRIENVSSPQNAIRLNKNTPCAHTGMCHDCLAPDCICMQTVITRNSRDKGRIQVILVGENLGY